jgi:hypothetical protein
MANERLYQFPSKASPVPADIIYVGDSANGFNEVNSTIAQIIAAYPNLSGYAGLTLGANSYAYTNNSSVLTAGTITALGVSLLADVTIANMQATLGFTPTPAASIFAGWDVNKNLTANNFLQGYATTATAGATTTLTVASATQQFFTGSTTQTVVLPVVSTLALGQSFYLVNESSGNVTVQSSGTNTIQVMGANTTLLVTCISLSGTSAASWFADYNFQTAISLPLSIANGGTAVASVTTAPAATAWAGWDANKDLSANNFLPAYASAATSGGTTTLVVGSAYYQFFTGTTTQTVVMPVTSTLVQGQSFYIVNNSTGAVTVQSSGANNIIVMAGSTTALLTCISTSGTTAASWNADYAQSGLNLPVSLANGGTNASLTASANGLVYSTASALAILATANSGVLVTSAGGVPSISSTLPAGLVIPQPSITGVINASAASAGAVGEVISSVIGSASAVSLTNNTAANVTSISLTAGDWDVYGNVGLVAASAGASLLLAWISTTSASAPNQSLYNSLAGAATTIVAGAGLSAPFYQVNVNTTTTVYLSTFATFGGTGTVCGGLFARRRR